MKLPLLMGLMASRVLWADAFQQNPIGGQLRKVDTGVTPIVPSALFISHHGFETETKTRTREIVRQHGSKGLQARSIATSGLNLDTLKSIAFSQAAIVAGVTALTALSMFMTGHAVNLNGLHWNGDHAFVSPWNFDLSLERMFEGVVVAGPLIVIENILRGSDNRDLSVVNLSTTSKSTTLFTRNAPSSPFCLARHGNDPVWPKTAPSEKGCLARSPNVASGDRAPRSRARGFWNLLAGGAFGRVSLSGRHSSGNRLFDTVYNSSLVCASVAVWSCAHIPRSPAWRKQSHVWAANRARTVARSGLSGVQRGRVAVCGGPRLVRPSRLCQYLVGGQQSNGLHRRGGAPKTHPVGSRTSGKDPTRSRSDPHGRNTSVCTTFLLCV